jgi:hypothetical protein
MVDKRLQLKYKIMWLYKKALKKRFDRFYEMQRKDDKLWYSYKTYGLYLMGDWSAYISEGHIFFTYIIKDRFCLRRNGWIDDNAIELDYIDLVDCYKFLRKLVLHIT